MTPLLSLLASSPYIQSLTSLPGWIGWLLLLVVIVFLLLRWRKYGRGGKVRWGIFVVTVVLVPLTNLFLGLQLSSGSALPEPNIPAAPHNPTLMLFASLPWMLAGGFLGPLPAAIIGLLCGLTRALWDSHNVFTILEPALLAVLFSVAVHQRYRTIFFRLLRQPALFALVLIPVYVLVFVFNAFFSVSGALAARLDYALTNVWPITLAVGGELILGGLITQLVAVVFSKAWGSDRPLEPSPGERNMEARFLLGGGTFIAILLLTLLIGDWIVAGNAARQMLRDRLSSTARAGAENVPFFLETGQNLIENLSHDPRLLNQSGADLVATLGEQIRTVPYFDQLAVLDSSQNVMAVYPASSTISLAPEEFISVTLAVQGVVVQFYAIPPAQGDVAARLSFIASIADDNGQVQRVLLGRTALSQNPLIQPLLNSLHNMNDLGGKGILLDDQGRILYHPNAELLMTNYLGQRSDQVLFYDNPAPGGTRELVYYQPVEGRSWGIVLTIPAQESQQLSLNIAAPLSAMIIVLTLLALVSLRVSLRVVTGSLRGLAAESALIARGKLDHPLKVDSVDEVGQLRGAFEQMRVSLQARLEELNQLLLVSQGVASSLEMGDAVQPILEAVLATGASAVRVVLLPSARQPEENPPRFALGPAKDIFAHLDDRVLKLTQEQERLVLNNPSRVRGLDLPTGQPQPGALAAVALRHENSYYGVLWAAYNQPRQFTDEDLRFLSTLAGQAALAASNARLFRSAELGRRRLEAILASTPDPVLVTDQLNRLLFANPAAKQAISVLADSVEGQPTERVIAQKELVNILQVFETGKQSAEVVMPDGNVYYATASSVIADGKPVGRVCVLRDITHFKELDALKSDFVSTVSHDLRSPLTLMRGYATMLEMVGDLNEQQHSYIRKMIGGVESMARLVNNLLDLGRIEAGVGLQVENVVLKEVIENIVGTLQLSASQKNLRLGLEMDRELPATIEADKGLLHQAVYNLVENAIKYTPEGGWVVLRVKARPTGVQFEAQDNGIGVAPADQPRLFEKFYRGSQREARTQRGTGLGLAIVRSIAERHGGKVWLESQVGKGSTFFLLVPYMLPAGTKRAN
jgi:PAS domain S-box-containing protein